jgi:predicted unusual protein kinase regulating ubiquinone biosynthesis (AarF/ABC1/UbiB family)
MLTIIDWALRERLSREQRRHLALLFLLVTLRDPVGTSNEVLALTQQHVRRDSPKGRMIADFVAHFLNELPAASMSGGVDAMLLLERLAMKDVKFPGPLIMLSKVMFTLDGILGDIDASTGTRFGLSIARHVAQHWITHRKEFRSPLMKRDWIKLQCSALLYSGRLWLKGEQALLDRLLPVGSTANLAST